MTNINTMMNQGIAGAVRTAARFYLRSPQGRKAAAQMIPAMREKARLRAAHEAQGLHVPPFLIASIASQCNLRCAGCYAHEGGACASKAPDMTAAEWTAVFEEASGLGVSMIMLAGGEPMMRPDVLDRAAMHKTMLFPIFTNGTMMDREAMDFFDENRHMVPVFSVEGEAADTDARRGDGVAAAVRTAMQALVARGILYGVSITVTRENLQAVTDAGFVRSLQAEGCGLVFYVEYVPAQAGTDHLVLTEADCDVLAQAVEAHRKSLKRMIVISFPGDEAAMGGCLAAGRGFFHINPAGGAEPCPFSPYSKHSLKNSTLVEVMQSGYFEQIRALNAAEALHQGGCSLFRQQDAVVSLVAQM